jgi:hypothetical protein
MQRIIFTLLCLLTLFTARSQVSIVSVSPDTVCPSGTFIVRVNFHIGPDRSMFTDSLRVSGYAFPPDTFKYTPYLAGHTFPDSLSFLFDTTMLNTNRTLYFVSTAHDTGAFFLLETTHYFNTTHIAGLTLVSSGQYNSDTFDIHHPPYRDPSPVIVVDSFRSICSNSTINLTATGPVNHGLYFWVYPYHNDTTYSRTVVVNGDSLLPYPYNNTYHCIYVDTSGHCGPVATTKSTNIIVKQTPAQNICVVTLDSSLTHNVVIWNKNQAADATTTALIDSFFIMRGSQQIAAQPYSAYSSYQDNNANISLQAWTYSITVKDACAQTNNFGNTITTMFQQQPNNGDVTWYPYIGAFSGTYSVMRNAGGNSSWTLLDTITANSSPITIHDTSSVIPPNTRYRVEAGGASCLPRSAYTIYSNVGVVGTTGIKSLASDLIEIYPNPANSTIHLPQNNLHVILSDVTGQKVDEVFNSGTTLDISRLTPGVYFLTYDAHTVKLVKL